jgi:hypothetical protein
MWKQRVKFETFTATDGRTIKGWKVRKLRDWLDDTKFFTPGLWSDYEQEWGETHLILATNGKLYTYTDESHEYGSAREGGERTEKAFYILELTNGDFNSRAHITIQDAIEALQQMGR